MGNTPAKHRPKPLTKMTVEIACMKVRAHLELAKDRKINEVMKDEKALMNMIKASVRNRTEELLQAEKVIADLKYIQACTTLISYSNVLKNNASLIAESCGDPSRLQEILIYIFSIMYSAQYLGLFSLDEFKQIMMNYFGSEKLPPITPDQVDPKIVEAFKIKASPLELNTYFVEMVERNKITIEKINQIGHKFGPNFVPDLPQPQVVPNPYAPGQGGYQPNSGQGFNPHPAAYNPYQQPYNSQQPNFNPYQGYNPNINQHPGFNPGFNPNFNPGYNPNAGQGFNPNSGSPYGPNMNNNNNQGNPYGAFNPTPIIDPSKNQNPFGKPIQEVTPKEPAKFVPPPPANKDPYLDLDIKNIEDIPLYPEMDRLSMDFKKNIEKPAAPAYTPNLNETAATGFSDLDNYTNKFTPVPVPIPVPSPVPAKLTDPIPAPINNAGGAGTYPYKEMAPMAILDPQFEEICENIRLGL